MTGDRANDSNRLLTLLSASEARSPSRCCFILHVRPDRLVDYVEAHQNVWTAMRRALADAGWRNYSLFVHPEDGLVVGYFEADDCPTAQEALASAAAARQWEIAMAEYFVPGGGEKQELPQYFFLA